MVGRLLQRFSFKQILIYIVVSAAVAAFLGYGAFEARRLIEGPGIIVLSPTPGSGVGGPVVIVKGSVRNAAFFSIDGKQAFTDEQGDFSASITPAPGLVIIQLAAKDRFGRQSVRNIEITLLPECLAKTSAA